VCRGQTVVVEERDRVHEQISSGIGRAPGLVRRRPPGVALVVADHEPTALSDQPAEPVRPPQHRAAEARNEEDGRIVRVAERLGIELDPIGVDQALADWHSSNASPFFVESLFRVENHTERNVSSPRKEGRAREIDDDDAGLRRWRDAGKRRRDG
jgi:hypothetical protein